MNRGWRGLGLATCLIVGASSAPAEQHQPNFFELLFGAQPAPPPQVVAPKPAASSRPAKPRRSDFVPSTTTRAPGAVGGAPAIAANFHVEILGDTLAGAASDGLTEAFANKPEIGFVNKARDASGLVRNDYFDWDKAAADAAGTDKPDLVVVMVGSNDAQSLHDGADWLDPLSDRWLDRYGQRVEGVVAPFVAKHIPVVWVGLPPMRVDKLNALAVKLNEVYRARAEKTGAKYIDIFEAFANAQGEYDAFGPDVEGQNAKLRAADGVHFTKAGARKVAHFLEAEVRRVFEKRNPQSEVAALPPDIEHEAYDINQQIRREMGMPAPTVVPAPETPGAAAPSLPPRPAAGPILPLTGRPISPGGALASRESHPLSEPPEVTRVLRVGEPNPPAPGRADDFAWPRI